MPCKTRKHCGLFCQIGRFLFVEETTHVEYVNVEATKQTTRKWSSHTPSRDSKLSPTLEIVMPRCLALMTASFVTFCLQVTHQLKSSIEKTVNYSIQHYKEIIHTIWLEKKVSFSFAAT